MTQRLYIDREEKTATLVEASITQGQVKKTAELTWLCESSIDYETVKAYYPSAKVITI